VRAWRVHELGEPQIFAETHAALIELWERREIDPRIGAELPLEQAPEALARLADRGTVGKVVLIP
jgi:NADPH2:quinone reductase